MWSFYRFRAEPRTVSLNDIVAEISGTIVGIFCWATFGKLFVRTAQTVFDGGRPALRAAIVLYILAYCTIVLFPFDFLVNNTELKARLYDPEALALGSPRILLIARRDRLSSQGPRDAASRSRFEARLETGLENRRLRCRAYIWHARSAALV